jgi:hypothetical protein
MSADLAPRWWLGRLSHSLAFFAVQCNDAMSGESLFWLLPGCYTMVRSRDVVVACGRVKFGVHCRPLQVWCAHVRR